MGQLHLPCNSVLCAKVTRQECWCLCIMHREICKLDPDQKIKLTNFRHFFITIFDITDDFILDNLFRMFDKDGDGEICMIEWVKNFSIWLRGTMDEKKKFCFSLYDLDGDGHLAREELYQLLKSTIVVHEDDLDEGVKDLVEVTLKMVDIDGDGAITFPDFSKAVDSEPLLLEVFGDCLPRPKALASFEAQFKSGGFTYLANYLKPGQHTRL